MFSLISLYVVLAKPKPLKGIVQTNCDIISVNK